ncbi:glycosyltransferase family 2 protein [Caryophanon latum]|uniref:Glycosyltransferase 2-like domain-containing protein n=1 Tax=Caryophanon latum TaxID=33977 RepID=A0A1C0YIR0_9BACL|nr:glycosyltransferase [Caryophanon latum]OCS87057.1 hypothetical protein A6K76_14075 [Caryophanon latum]
MSCKISVIIPIYNVADYLEICLQSILNQNFKDFEVILVNDGSEDDSLKICEKYIDLDNRMKLINQSNKGVSTARNNGMKQAHGEYLVFIDPDDWIESSMLEKLYNKVTKLNLNIVLCAYSEIFNGNRKIISLETSNDLLESAAILDELIGPMISSENLDSNITPVMGSACRAIYKKSFLESESICFDSSLPLMEDLCFMIQILSNVNQVGVINEPLYNYVNRESSASIKYRANMYDIQKKVYSKIEDLISVHINGKIEEYLNNRYITIRIVSIINEVSNPNGTFKETLKYIKKICSDFKFLSLVETLDVRKYTLRKKVLYYMFRKQLFLGIYLYYKLLKFLIERK